MIFLSKLIEKVEIIKYVNSLFVNVGNKLASKYPPSEVVFEIRKDCKFHFNKKTHEERVRDAAFQCLQSSKGPGYNEISSNMKNAFEEIYNSLCNILQKFPG